MSSFVTRREFLAGTGILATTTRFARTPVGHIEFGYAAITWGGDDRQAIKDISSLGFRGIQLRVSAFEEWRKKPSELREILARHGLRFVAFSSGLVRLDPRHEQDDLTLHVRHAEFVRECGGVYLQVFDERPQGRAPTLEEFARMGRLLTELGRRTADLGIPLGYHNHLGNLGERPEEVVRVLEASDSRFVKLELDIAHYHQAGGNPAQAIETHAERLLFLHIKDVEPIHTAVAPQNYRFVELGRGQVDLKAVFEALARVQFEGWAVIELDAVPDNARTPKESAFISKRYLEETLGLEV